MKFAVVALALLGADDRPEDDRFESENRSGLKKGEHAIPDAESGDAPGKKTGKSVAKAAKPAAKVTSALRVADIAAMKGTEAAVEGTIFQVHVPKGDILAELNLGKDFRKCFSVVIRAKDFGKFGGLEKIKAMRGKSLRIEGMVSIYRDKPQIEATVPSQLVVK